MRTFQKWRFESGDDDDEYDDVCSNKSFDCENVSIFCWNLNKPKRNIILAEFVEKNSSISRAKKMYEIELANSLTTKPRAFCKKMVKRSQKV
jgi:hypothetical protein